MIRTLALCMTLAFGCSRGSRSGGMPANHRPPEQAAVIAYRSGPGGFPIPADAVDAGRNAFVVPRPHHVTARMQREKLVELGFTIDSVDATATFYMFHVTKGDQSFAVSISSRTTDSSELVLGVASRP